MRCKVFSDNELIYDSTKPELILQQLQAIDQLTAAGYARITVPPTHPIIQNYDYEAVFHPHAIFKITKNIADTNGRDETVFRGRICKWTTGLYLSRELTLEGERAFFKDTVIRPQTFTGTLTAIFSALIAAHDQQTDASHGFTVGTVSMSETGTHTLEIKEPETTFAALSDLISAYGGYLLFEDDENTGHRLINWTEEITAQSEQPIELGVNLTGLTISGTVDGYANRIIPFGAKINGVRVTLSYNGHDYVEESSEQTSRGIVSKSVIFDDATTSAQLLPLAQAELERSIATEDTLAVDAFDLSTDYAHTGCIAADWRPGYLVQVVSPPHGINGYYQITERQYDLLHPKNDKVSIGPHPATISGN